MDVNRDLVDKIIRWTSQEEYNLLFEFAHIYAEEERKFLNRRYNKEIERGGELHKTMIEIRLNSTIQQTWEWITYVVKRGKKPELTFPRSPEEIEEKVMESYDRREL